MSATQQFCPDGESWNGTSCATATQCGEDTLYRTVKEHWQVGTLCEGGCEYQQDSLMMFDPVGGALTGAFKGTGQECSADTTPAPEPFTPDPNGNNCMTDQAGNVYCAPTDPDSGCGTMNGVLICPDPDLPDGCGDINGQILCADDGQNCGYFNGEYVCADSDGDSGGNADNCFYNPKDGSLVCVSDDVQEKSDTGTTENPDGSTTTTTTEGSNVSGTGSKTTTTTTSPDGSSSSTTTSTTGTATDKDGDGKPDEEDDLNWGKPAPDDGAPFSETMGELWDQIAAVPIVAAVDNLRTVDGTGQCPEFSITWMDGTSALQTTLHCDLFESLAPILSVVFLALWSWAGISIFMRA